MNIFYLDHDVTNCAKMHADKHCVKMILEYAQLLSTAHKVIDGIQSVGVSKKGRKQTQYVLPDDRESSLYSATHINHPSAIWARHSASNYAWLFQMFVALMDEYTHRYDKVHACDRLTRYLRRTPNNIVEGAFTQPTPAMPEQYMVTGDSIKSYRNYYVGEKSQMFAWKRRDVPAWIVPVIPFPPSPPPSLPAR
jgi:hypothetical protein